MCCYCYSNLRELQVLVLTDSMYHKEVKELKGTVNLKALGRGR